MGLTGLMGKVVVVGSPARFTVTLRERTTGNQASISPPLSPSRFSPTRSASTTGIFSFPEQDDEDGVTGNGRIVRSALVVDASVQCAGSLEREELVVDVHDNGDGSFSCAYIATRSGTVTVRVRVMGRHVTGSPFMVEARLRSPTGKAIRN